MRLTDTQTLTNKTFDISANTLKNSSNTAGHYPRNNGTQYVDSALQSSDLAPTYTNNAGGTAANLLVKLTGAPSTTVTTAITDTGGAIGICVSGCGASGTPQIAKIGAASCIFDGATTAGDYVGLSSTVAGNCRDIGASFPSVGQVVGRVLSTNVAGGTYAIDLFPSESRGFAPGGIAVNAVDLTAQGANCATQTFVTPAANGYYRLSINLTITQAATTSSSTPIVTFNYTDAGSSTAQSFNVLGSSSSNSLGQQGIMANGLFSTLPPFFGVFAKSGVAITLTCAGYATSGATPMQYALHGRLEGPY